MKRKNALLGVMVLGLIYLPLWAGPQPQVRKTPPAHASDKESAPPRQSETHPSNGQRVFEQNCSRCHADPDGFSPRISGTVARHMRVRASLSKKDEQDLLRFLNP